MEQTTYFTGKACRYGHLAPRYFSNGVCVVCNRETTRAIRRKRMAERRASDPMREVTFTTVQVTQPCFVEVATAACTLAQARWPRVALQELADTCCQVPRSGEANGRRFYRMPCHPDDGATLQLLADMAEAAMFKRFREGLGEAIKSGALRT